MTIGEGRAERPAADRLDADLLSTVLASRLRTCTVMTSPEWHMSFGGCAPSNDASKLRTRRRDVANSHSKRSSEVIHGWETPLEQGDPEQSSSRRRNRKVRLGVCLLVMVAAALAFVVPGASAQPQQFPIRGHGQGFDFAHWRDVRLMVASVNNEILVCAYTTGDPTVDSCQTPGHPNPPGRDPSVAVDLEAWVEFPEAADGRGRIVCTNIGGGQGEGGAEVTVSFGYAVRLAAADLTPYDSRARARLLAARGHVAVNNQFQRFGVRNADRGVFHFLNEGLGWRPLPNNDCG